MKENRGYTNLLLTFIKAKNDKIYSLYHGYIKGNVYLLIICY